MEYKEEFIVVVHDLTSKGASNAQAMLKAAIKLGMNQMMADPNLCKKYGLEERPEFVVTERYSGCLD